MLVVDGAERLFLKTVNDVITYRMTLTLKVICLLICVRKKLHQSGMVLSGLKVTCSVLLNQLPLYLPGQIIISLYVYSEIITEYIFYMSHVYECTHGKLLFTNEECFFFQAAMNETFYLSNILPQNYENNAGKATLFYLFDYVTRRSEKLGFQKK